MIVVGGVNVEEDEANDGDETSEDDTWLWLRLKGSYPIARDRENNL